jgi:hypothetical protein
MLQMTAAVVLLLLSHKPDVSIHDNQGRTALMASSSTGDVTMVDALVSAGADLKAADAAGSTALTYAAAQGKAAAVSKLEVGSPTLKADQPMSKEYTADGHNVSPPLTWSAVPSDTKSIAVVCADPDAGNPPPFVHWVIYNIPPVARSLPESVPFEPGAVMPSELSGAVQGLSGFRRPMYRGPAPPPGKPHHYHFTVYAIDIGRLGPNLTRAELLEAIKGHVLASGELVTIYERKP